MKVKNAVSARSTMVLFPFRAFMASVKYSIAAVKFLALKASLPFSLELKIVSIIMTDNEEISLLE